MPCKSYVLGYSEREMQRIAFQAGMLDPITKRMLQAAEIRDGQDILDIGCGSGYVSQLAAKLVGDGGAVIGIEQSEAALNFACSTGLKNVSFVQGRFEKYEFEKQFDIVVGRTVLLFQDDVISFLRRAAKWVKPGGYLAFHEIDCSRQCQSKPPVALWDRTMTKLLLRLRNGCPQYDIGQRFVQAFDEAGLPTPNVSYEIPVAGGHAEDLCLWAVETLCSLSDQPERIVFADGEVMDPARLLASLQEDIFNARSQVEFLGQACAWVQIK
ncbi:class I SAM-dependent methyltransferase [Lonsdalea quercina]|uniref:class I SAM-dependent methyltransferase n=1 Tax=Lonsdalea quercina TaxID=71657 RepID=UPI0039757B7A